MLKKLSNTINEKSFIKKVITLDEINKVIDDLKIKNKENYLKKDFMKVNKFKTDPYLPKKTTSFSVIDKHTHPVFLQAVGLCFIF